MDNTSTEKSSKGKVIGVVVILLIALAIAGYFMYGTKLIKEKVVSVATVNGVVIPKTEYDTQLATSIASFKSQGVDVTNADKLSQIKTQVLNDLISNELVTQGIVAAGIKATSEDVEKQFQAILAQTGGADKLKEELVKANSTEEKLRANIAKQLEIQAYLLKNVNLASVTVSDAEIAQFYENYSNSQKAAGVKTIPPLKDLSEAIRQQIMTSKQQSLVVDFIATLRAKAKIETSTNL